MILPLFCIIVYSDILFKNIYGIVRIDTLLKESIENRFTCIYNWRTLVTIDQVICWLYATLLQAYIGYVLSLQLFRFQVFNLKSDPLIVPLKKSALISH